MRVHPEVSYAGRRLSAVVLVELLNTPLEQFALAKKHGRQLVLPGRPGHSRLRPL